MKKTPLHECISRNKWKSFIVFKFALLFLLTCSLSFNAKGNYEAENQVQQDIQVRGSVTDSRGEPLVGVSVIIQGTTIGTVTDVSGGYSISVPDEQSVLAFSYVGYNRQSRVVGDQRTIDIVLVEDVAILDEIVVVGYATRRQSELSSSVSIITQEQLAAAPASTNLGVMLQGRAPGLNISNISGMPGSGSNMTIRGAGSIGAGITPLIVVDGIIGGQYNPRDIESVTVLKDAAATGIYGSRASNGVIIITTRSGRPDDFRVSVSNTSGPTYNWDNRIDLYNSAELYERQTTAMRNLFDLRVAQGHPSFVDASFEDYRNNIVPPDAPNTDTDWYGLLNRTGFLNQTQISMSGGTERTVFYMSGNFNYERATMIDRQFTEGTIRTNVSHNILDNLTATVRLSGEYSERPNYWHGNRPRVESYEYNPMDDPFMEGGIGPEGNLRPLADPASGRWFFQDRSNYLLERATSDSHQRNAGGQIAAELNWNPTNWLRLNSNTRLGGSLIDRTVMHTADNIRGVIENGWSEWRFDHGTSITTSNTAHTQHSLGNHNFFGIFGQEYSHEKSMWNLSRGHGVVGGMTAIGSTGVANSVDGTMSETGFKSYFGQMDYNYQSKYFLVGSLRWDASSVFGPDFKWGNFYSLGANWLLSREDFLIDLDWLDVLKLRASYGKTGNASIASYLHMGTYSFTNLSSYDGRPGAQPSRLPNPSLTWESAYTTNIGAEIAVFNRATFEIDLYQTINKDLLQAVPLPSTSGFASQQRNIGSVQNLGIDLNITNVNIDRQTFRWVSNLNMNFNRSKVLELFEGTDIFTGQFIIREGLPLRYWYMREWQGVNPDDGTPMWTRWEDEDGRLIHGRDTENPYEITTTGQYEEASLIPIASAYPDFTGGFANDLYYNNFSLSVLTNFAVGQKVFTNVNHSVHDALGNRIKFTKWQDFTYWEQPGDQADFPQLIFTDPSNSRNNSSLQLYDGSYLRIQRISLGYTFTRTVVGISNLNIGASLDNAAIFTRFPWGDPDVNMESPQAGIQRYRPVRRLLFTVRFDITN